MPRGTMTSASGTESTTHASPTMSSSSRATSMTNVTSTVNTTKPTNRTSATMHQTIDKGEDDAWYRMMHGSGVFPVETSLYNTSIEKVVFVSPSKRQSWALGHGGEFASGSAPGHCLPGPSLLVVLSAVVIPAARAVGQHEGRRQGPAPATRMWPWHYPGHAPLSWHSR